MRRVTAILLQQTSFGPNVVHYVLGTQLIWAKTWVIFRIMICIKIHIQIMPFGGLKG